MLRKLLMGIVALMALFHTKAQAQDTSVHHTGTVGCGFSAPYLATKAVSAPGIGATASYTPPALFPPSAIDTCGKFRVFYVDAQIALATSLTGGFAAAGGVGATRRNTMCTVLGYIQSRLDFSKIPAGQYINLLIDTSKSNVHHIDGRWPNGSVGIGTPFYDPTGKAPGDTINGFVYDYAMSGTDPNPGDYHATLIINFDSVQHDQASFLLGYDNGGSNEVMYMHDGITNVSNCEWDLYTILVHQLGHVIGWFAWNDGLHGAPYGGFTTNFQSALQYGPDPHTAPNPFAPGLLVPLSTIPYTTWYYSVGRIWVNTKQTPHNLPMSGISPSHLNNEGASYIYGTRISPGDYQEYVMQYGTIRGRMKRTFFKGELETWHDIIGYNYNPTYATDSAAIIANNVPWSSKMSYRYNPGFDSATFTETVPAEYTITNNTGTTLSFNINSDTTLHDDDGDSLSVYPGSMVNFRGCGSGGNNHSQISISPDGKTITYTPRANFYGRAQLGFNLYDGHEKGAFVVYTIEVKKGTNVSATLGSNLVQNGNFEEGTEVKIRDIAENVNNTCAIASRITAGRWGWGTQWADGQIGSGTAIRHSYVECEEGFSSPYNYGDVGNTFPYYGPITITGSTGGITFNHPEAVSSSGDRYQSNGGGGTLYLLLDSVRKCNRYLLECDVYRTFTDTVHRYAYTPREMVRVGFTTNTFVTAMPDATHLIQTYAPYYSTPFGAGSWQHLKIPISYCNDTPSTAMYLSFSSGGGTRDYVPWLLVDNVSLKEVDTLIVHIKDSATAPCMRRLYPDIPNMGCSMSYTWKKIIGATVTTVSTDSAIEISTMLNGKYSLTVADGCGRTATDTFTIIPCACSPGALFGVSADSVLTGSISGTLASGVYYVPSDITISGATTLTAADVLMAPGVTITVAPTAKLTINASHLFTCPDSSNMWQGIVLASSGTTSGRIEVTNNTLIEDAKIAISANNPKIPSSGDIIHSYNSVYNRNQLDVLVQNLNTSTPATYPIYLVGNVFTSRLFNSSTYSGYPAAWPTAAALKTKLTPNSAKASYTLNRNYARAKAKDGNMSYMSLEFDYVGLTTGAGVSFSEVQVGGASTKDSMNMFDDKKYGIYANRSNVTVQNSIFMNMYKRWDTSSLPGSVLPDWGGIGVFARSDSFRYDRLRIMPTLGNLADTFFDCYDGIGIDGLAEVTVTNAFFTTSHVYGQITPGAAYPTDINTGTGMFLGGNKNQNKWNVSSNIFSNVNTGIYAGIGKPVVGATTNFDGNKMYAANPISAYSSYTGGQYMMIGMDLNSVSSSGNANTLSASNNNPMYNLYNGISLNGLKSSTNTVNSNTITLLDKTASSTMTQYGINILNTNNATVSSNTISTSTGLGAAANADRIYGINTSSSSNVSICSNTTTNIGRAFGFTGKTPQSGIRWVLNSMTNSYKGMVLGSDIGYQASMTDYSSGLPRVYQSASGNTWNGPGTWGLSTAHYQTYETDGILTTKSILYVHNTPTELPTVNWSNIFGGGSFPLVYQYSGTTGSIQAALAQAPAVNCTGSIYPIRVNSIPRPGTLGMMILKDSLGYGLSANPNQWMAQLAMYELNVVDSTLVDSSNEYKMFIDSAANSRFAWINGIETALDNEDATTAQSLLNSPVSALGRVATGNLGVVITDYTEADYVVDNYTQYFSAYIDYLNGAFTSGDHDIINALANGCPARDGAVVYRARAFNSILTHNYTEYNDEGCLYGGGAELRMGKDNLVVSENYTLYPNPNNGTFVIRQNNVQDKLVQMKVYNALGAVIYQTNANFTGGTVQVNFGKQAAGLYLICMDDGTEHTTCLRFVIK